MFYRVMSLLLFLTFAATAAVADEMQDPKEIVDRMIAAAGGEAFAKLGVLELEVTEDEIHNDGTQSGKSYTLLVDTSNLDNMRMELPGKVVVADQQGWRVVDRRPTCSMTGPRSRRWRG